MVMMPRPHGRARVEVVVDAVQGPGAAEPLGSEQPFEVRHLADEPVELQADEALHLPGLQLGEDLGERQALQLLGRGGVDRDVDELEALERTVGRQALCLGFHAQPRFLLLLRRDSDVSDDLHSFHPLCRRAAALLAPLYLGGP